MTEIIPRLFLGSYEDVKNVECDLIINCTKDLEFAGKSKYKLRIPIDDTPKEEKEMNEKYNKIFAESISKATDSISNVLHSGGSVFVHCQLGVSRSATLVMCHLLRHHGMTPQEAYDLIKKKRPIVFHFGFNFEHVINSSIRH